jgi:hypothetical protein
MQQPMTLASIADELGLLLVDDGLLEKVARAASGGVVEGPLQGHGLLTPVHALVAALDSLTRFPSLVAARQAVDRVRLGAKVDTVLLMTGDIPVDGEVRRAIAMAAQAGAEQFPERVLDDLLLALAVLREPDPATRELLSLAGLDPVALAAELSSAFSLEVDGEGGKPLSEAQLRLHESILHAAGSAIAGHDLATVRAFLQRGHTPAVLYLAGSPYARRVTSIRAFRRFAGASPALRVVPRLIADFAFSPSSRAALGLADALRGEGRGVHVEHLLLALYDAKEGPTRQAFTHAGIDRAKLLQRLRTVDFDAPPFRSSKPAEALPPMSSHAAFAVALALRSTTAANDTVIRSRDLLVGLFDLEGCHVIEQFPEIRRELRDNPPRVDPTDPPEPQRPREPDGALVPAFGGDGLDGRDVLGFSLEVDAIARLVASDGVDPPLSIGLFGEWGSGKSYFMRRLRERIDGFASATRRRREIVGVPTPGYVGHVVQVEFNAWNYVEVDLWASLVAHIFDRLHAHVTDEAGAEQRQWESLLHRLDDAEARRHDAKQALELAQLRLDARRREQAARERTLAYQIEILRRHKKLKQPIADIENTLGIAAARELWDAIVLRSTRVNAVIKAMPRTLQAARSLFTGPAAWWLISAIALVIVLLLVAWHLQWFPNLAAIAAALPLLLKWVQTAMGRSDALLRAIERFQEAMLELERSKRELDREALERLREEARAVEHARAEHDVERARVEQLRGEIARLYPGEQLADFLADRAASSDYRKHLGLPALVRRDFDRLGRLVRPHTHRIGKGDVEGLAEATAPADLCKALAALDDDDPFVLARVERVEDRVKVYARDGRYAILDRRRKQEREEVDEATLPYLVDLRSRDDEPLGKRNEDGKLLDRQGGLATVRAKLVDGAHPATIPAKLAELLRRNAPLRGPEVRKSEDGTRWEIRDHDGARSVEIGFDGMQAVVEISWPMHPTIERIVLYIDDLDRCPPSRVVEVLGAVHLLLAFPLFVVVVAVDERWLVGSLQEHHAGQLRDADEQALAQLRGAFEGLARPRDYLEKIFQIPYWVPRMTTLGAQALVAELVTSTEAIQVSQIDPTRVIRPDRPKPKLAEAGVAGDVTASADADVAGPDVESETPAPPADDDGTDDGGGMPGLISRVADGGAAADTAAPADAAAAANAGDAQAGSEGNSGPATDTLQVPAPEVDQARDDEALLRSRVITIDRDERRALQALVPLVQKSPRAIKRFVNVYRVLRSTLTREDSALLRHDNVAVPFGPVTLLVAMMVGDPENGAGLIERIEAAPEAATLREIMAAWLGPPPPAGTDEPPCRDALRGALADDRWGTQLISALGPLPARVRRFSFGARAHTG